MLLRSPSDKPPRSPPREKRDADTYLLVLAFVSFVFALFIVAYALFI